MTKQEYESKLQDLQNQIEELKKVKIEEENKVWKPKDNEYYYFISADGTIVHTVWTNIEHDNDLYRIGNCFKCEEDAYFEKEKRIIRAKFKRYLKEHNDSIDFDKINTKWYNLELDIVRDTVSPTVYAATITNDYVASSKEILEEAIEFVGGEEVAKKYLFDYIGE